MDNLPHEDIELLNTYERLARALEAMHLNHEQRGERIALIGAMLRNAMDYASPEFLKWLYPLYHLLLTLYVSGNHTLTHRDVKHGLRFFAEVCMEARKDLEVIHENARLRSRSNVYAMPLEVSSEATNLPAKSDDIPF